MGLPILNDDLRECLESVLSIQFILKKDLTHVDTNKSYLDNLVPEPLKNTYSKDLKKTLKFKQRILRDAYKTGVILLTATFERISLAKYRTASGDLISFIQKSKDPSIEYFIVKDKFIIPSLTKLADLLELLKNRIDTGLYEKLSEIKELRNSFAHENLDTLTTINEYPLLEIADTFDKVLIEIEKRSVDK